MNNGVKYTVAEAIEAKDKCNELILACDEFQKVATKQGITIQEVLMLKERMIKDVEFLNNEIKRNG